MPVLLPPHLKLGALALARNQHTSGDGRVAIRMFCANQSLAVSYGLCSDDKSRRSPFDRLQPGHPRFVLCAGTLVSLIVWSVLAGIMLRVRMYIGTTLVLVYMLHSM